MAEKCSLKEEKKRILNINKYCKSLKKIFYSLYDLKDLNHVKSVNCKEKELFCNRAIYAYINKIIIAKILTEKNNINDCSVKEYIEYYFFNFKTYHLMEKIFGNVEKNLIKDIFSFNLKYENINPTYDELKFEVLLKYKSNYSLFCDYNILLKKIIEEISKINFINNEDKIGKIYESIISKEHRRSIGLFYTPEYIIECIIENTFERFSPLEQPFAKIADISSGTGYFIIKAYDLLKNTFLDNIEKLNMKYKDEIYVIKRNGKNIKIKGEDYWREENIHCHILNNCLYAADIDVFATQIMVINLLLKDINAYVYKINIVNCDSLIKWEHCHKLNFKYIYTKNKFIYFRYKTYRIKNKEIEKNALYKIKEDHNFIKRFKLYNFWRKKFDYIIGNPPWVSLSRKNKKSYWEDSLNYYIKNYGGNLYSPNLFEYFIKRALEKTKEGGYIAFVVPINFSRNAQYTELRSEIFEKYNVKNLFFNIVFPGVITDAMVFILEKNKSNHNKISFQIMGNNKYELSQEEYFKYNNCELNFNRDDLSGKIKAQILKETSSLGEVSNTFTGFIGNSKKIYKEKLDKNYVEVYKGKNIDKFICKEPCYYDLKCENIKGGTKDLRKLKYKEKILVRKTGKEIIAAYDNNGIIIEQSLYGIIDIHSNLKCKYILAILNSELINWYYRNYLITNKESTPQIKKYRLDKIPIKICNRNMQDEIEFLVDRIMYIFQNKKDLNSIESVDYYVDRINEKIFYIYGITNSKIINYIKNYK